MRIYNPSLGKFLSVDPLTQKYPYLTPYQFASNRPIIAVDLDGAEALDIKTGKPIDAFNQNAVCDIPNDDYTPWLDLLTSKTPEWVLTLARNRMFKNEGANIKEQFMYPVANTNFDYYSVVIEKLPDGMTSQDFFNYVRKNFGEFKKGSNTDAFEPYNESEKVAWESSFPTSAVMHFHVEAPWFAPDESMNVITEQFGVNYWVFTPIGLNNSDGDHPLAGRREFGLVPFVENNTIKYTFFTRAVDQAYGINKMAESMIFSGATNLWQNVMGNITTYVNSKGGKANVGAFMSKQITPDLPIDVNKLMMKIAGFKIL